jgi:SM-20-related protein
MSCLIEESVMDWAGYWQKYFDDHMGVLDTLVDDGFTIIDDALPQDLYAQLVHESLDKTNFQAAKITTGGRLDTVRSDSTRWIDMQDEIGKQYLAALLGLGEVLNQFLYIGIRSVEAHFAQYQIGQFYAAHRDNAKESNVRAISTVLYLNDFLSSRNLDNIKTEQLNSQKTWQAEWGGALRLNDNHDVAHHILPIANRLVVFQSDLPHEVLPANKIRRSIAGWLRRDERL